MAKGRGGIRQTILVGVAFALLALAVWMNREQIREVFNRPFQIGPFVAAFGIYFVGLLLTFYRWFTLVRALDVPIQFRDALRLGFIGNVYNLVIPGAVGGDVLKGAFFCREQGGKKNTRAISSIVLDRILGLMGLFLLAGLCGLPAWAKAEEALHVLIVVVWSAFFGGVVLLTIVFTPSLYKPVNRLLVKRPKLEAILVELEFMAGAYRRQFGVLLGVLLLSLLIHGLNVFAFYLISQSLFRGDPNLPGLLDHYVITPLVLFSIAIPIPFGALGVSEQVGLKLFDLVNYKGGGVAMMGFRILMYTGGVVSLCVYLANRSQVRALEQTAEVLDIEHRLHPDKPDPEMLQDVDPELDIGPPPPPAEPGTESGLPLPETR